MAKKTTKQTKDKKYIAIFNQRIDGFVQEVQLPLVRKGESYFTEDGLPYVFNGAERLVEV